MLQQVGIGHPLREIAFKVRPLRRVKNLAEIKRFGSKLIGDPRSTPAN